MSTRDAGTASQIMVVDIEIAQIIIPVSRYRELAYSPGSANSFANATKVIE
jgi:hypothetical protein